MLFENYGPIGERQAVALVGWDGAADRLCPTRFDYASCITAPPSAEHRRRLLATSTAGTDAR